MRHNKTNILRLVVHETWCLECQRRLICSRLFGHKYLAKHTENHLNLVRIQTKSQTVPAKVQFQDWFSLGTYLIQLGVIMGYFHIVSFYQ